MMEDFQKLLASGKFKTLNSVPVDLTKPLPKGVTSIYDTMNVSWYSGVSVAYLFQVDIGYMEWAIKNMDDFCIREFDYLTDLSTFAKKTYEMRHAAPETRKRYHELSEKLSDDEMLAAMGGHQYFRKLDVKSANDRKLQKFGISPTPLKISDRTYLCYHRSSFPKLSGNWEFEQCSQSAKGSMVVFLKKTLESYSSMALLEDKLGLIVSLGPLASFKDKQVEDNYSFDFFEPGEKVSIETNSDFSSTVSKYLICKI
jgi:hypothetical protein